MSTKRAQFIQAHENLKGYLKMFMSSDQRHAMLDMIKGEEGEYFVEVVNSLTKRIQEMPVTYATDGQGGDAIVYLHYFRGSINAWVTERDVGVKFEDGTRDDTQTQAFGRVDMGHGSELGYIAINQLIEYGIELDLYWTPKKLRECK